MKSFALLLDSVLVVSYVIEFGKSLIAKCGYICASVEDVLDPSVVTGETGDAKYIAITHAGADLLLRTAYCPQQFTHRFHLVQSGLVGQPSMNDEDLVQHPCKVTIAGPLCFRCALYCHCIHIQYL